MDSNGGKNCEISYEWKKQTVILLSTRIMQPYRSVHHSPLLTTDGLPPAIDLDPCRCTGMHIRRDCSTHALLAFLNSYSCHTCSSVRGQNKERAVWGDWSGWRRQTWVKVVAVRLDLFVRVRNDLLVAWGKHSLRITQHGAPVHSVLLC